MGFQHNLYIKPSKKDKQVPSYLYGQGGDINLKDWIQEALTKGYITAPSSGGGEGLPNPFVEDLSYDMDSYSLSFINGGSTTLQGSTTNGRLNHIIIADSDIFGTGAQGTWIANLDTIENIISFFLIGDMSPIGLTSLPHGAVFGVTELSANHQSSLRLELGTDGSTICNLLTNDDTGGAGDVTTFIFNGNTGSGESVITLLATGENQTAVQISALSTAPGVGELILTAGVDSQFPVQLTITEAKMTVANLQTFADDAAAGVGGLVSGDIYIRSTGELSVKL